MVKSDRWLHLPSSAELPCSDDTPVDNEDQNLIPNILLFLLKFILADRNDWFFGVDMGVYHPTGVSPLVPVVPDGFLSLERHDVKSPMMKAMSGTLICIPLHGEKLVQQWKTRVANYPEALAQAMVEQYLKFFPLWGLQKHLAERDATLFYYQILIESAQNLLGVLSGLNRLYYSTFQFKRMERFIKQMSIAPINLTSRLESLFYTETDAAANQLEELVQETLDLIDIHMPQVDTLSVRRRVGWRQQPWQIPLKLQ